MTLDDQIREIVRAETAALRAEIAELLSFIHACKKLDEPFARAWEWSWSR